jgi:hypothetical protein
MWVALADVILFKHGALDELRPVLFRLVWVLVVARSVVALAAKVLQNDVSLLPN